MFEKSCFEVSPEQIDDTFHEKYRSLDLYSDIWRNYLEGKITKPGDLTKILGLSRTKDKKEYARMQGYFVRWVGKDRPPPSVSCIQDLHRVGIFSGYDENLSIHELIAHKKLIPFNEQNRHFTLVALLSSYAAWRGGMREQKHSGCDLEYQVDYLDDHFLALIRVFLGKALDIAPTNHRFSTPGFFSRFLQVFGFSSSERVAQNDPFPTYVEKCVEIVNSDQNLNPSLRILAERVIRDFILSFFYGDKCSYSDSRGYSAVLPFHMDKKVSEERRRIFGEAAWIAGVDVRFERTRQMGGEGFEYPTYSNVAFFHGESEKTIAEKKDEFRGRLIYLTESCREIDR